MSENWAAVAEAINQRVNELGWRQSELSERSNVSEAIVREIQRNTVNRRRSTRTLEALSATLGWHPRHLDAILHGNEPPRRDENAELTNEFAARLDAVERRLDAMTDRLDDLKTDLATVIEHVRRP